MKKLIFLLSLLSVTVLFSGCCHFWCVSGPQHAVILHPHSGHP